MEKIIGNTMKGIYARWKKDQELKQYYREQNQQLNQPFEINNPTPKKEKYSLNKQYYHLNPSNPNEYRTITLIWNPYTSSHRKPLISNYVVGSPPPDLTPISQFHLSTIMRMNPDPPPF